MSSGPTTSVTSITLPKNSHGFGGVNVYRPIVCAQNLGIRTGVKSHFSYGPKRDNNGIISGLLSGGKAMDYSRQSGVVEFYLFQGDVEIDIATEEGDTFNNSLNSAGDEIFSLFMSSIPGGNVIGTAKNIFTNIASASETNLISAGEAVVVSYWSRINPDGSGEKGRTIRNPKRQSVDNWSVEKDKTVNVGQFFAIYIDISTKFQQRSEGYWDFWNMVDPPDRHAKVVMDPDDDPESGTSQKYYKIRGIGP